MTNYSRSLTAAELLRQKDEDIDILRDKLMHAQGRIRDLEVELQAMRNTANGFKAAYCALTGGKIDE